jgi:hypothetical protein
VNENLSLSKSFYQLVYMTKCVLMVVDRFLKMQVVIPVQDSGASPRTLDRMLRHFYPIFQSEFSKAKLLPQEFKEWFLELNASSRRSDKNNADTSPQGNTEHCAQRQLPISPLATEGNYFLWSQVFLRFCNTAFWIVHGDFVFV